MNAIIQHQRFFDESEKSDTNPNGIKPCGGITIAILTDSDKFKWGISRCHENDVFNRRIGVNKATGRAKSKKAFLTSPLERKELIFKARELASNILCLSTPKTQEEFEEILNGR